MTEHDKADHARKGLVDSVKGKAKEIVGAMTGNDSLTAEGQLEQTQARDRKEANSVEAVADAEAAGVENSVRSEQAAQKRAAEQAAQQDAAQAKTRAELDAQLEVQRAKDEEREEIGAAAEEAVDAAAEHQSSVQAATSAQAEADRIRRQADKLINEADLR